MLRVLSRAQLRELDRLASERCGVPSIVLMENAGRGAAEVIERELSTARAESAPGVLVVAGIGNNAGDGYVVARRLSLRGIAVEVLAVGEPEKLRGDALVNQRAFLGVGGKVSFARDAAALAAIDRASWLVDALFGTGLDRPLEGVFEEAVQRINRRVGKCIALDIPSGLECDTGRVLGAAVRADVTVTFAAHKLGLLTPGGRAHAGRLELVDIGVPPEALPEVGESARLLQARDIAALLPRRAVNAHKGSSGRVLVLAGSAGKIGAALLVASGALRAGAGLVTLGGPPPVVDALDGRVLEAMTARFQWSSLESTLGALLARADAVVIGPGIGLDADAKRLVETVVFGHNGPIVVDADALTHFAGSAEALADSAGRLILTPHPAELGRLLGTSAQEVENDRPSALARAVALTRAVVLLKGPHTLIGSPGSVPAIGRAGSSVLATGGSGDVLSGVLGAFACTLQPLEAAMVGAYLHARAGELWAQDSGSDRGLLAHEVADFLPRARAELSARDDELPV